MTEWVSLSSFLWWKPCACVKTMFFVYTLQRVALNYSMICVTLTQGRRSAFEAQGVEKTSKNFAPAAHRWRATNSARQNSKKNPSLFLSFFLFLLFLLFFFFCFPFFFPSFFSFPAHFKQKTSKIKVHGDKIWKKGKIAGKRPLIFSKPGSAGSRKITEPPSTPFLLPLRPWGPPTLP